MTGAFVANILTKARERRRIIEERRFDIYMKLLELYGSYFWFSAMESRGEPVPNSIADKCRDLAWQIADMLRSAGEVDFLDEILDITHGPKFKTAADRYHTMGR